MVARTFTFQVQAPATSYAAQLAQRMASNSLSTETLGRAGTASTRINESVGDLGQTFTAGKRAAFNNYADSNAWLLQWSGKAICDGTNWWYIAGTTGAAAGNQTVVKYDVASDEFSHWTGLGGSDVVGLFGYGTAHNFNSLAFNPLTGRAYRLLAANNPAPVAVWSTSTAASGVSGSLGTIMWPTTYGANFPTYPSMICHPGMGSQGALVVVVHGYEGSGSQELRRMDLSNNAALATINTGRYFWRMASACYHTASTHANGYVYWTSDNDTSCLFYRMDANGNVTECATPPTRMNSEGDTYVGGSVQPTDHTVLCPLGSSIYAFKVANNSTGRGRGIYKFDPSGSTGGKPGVWTNTNTDLSTVTLWDTNFTVGPLESVGVALLVYTEQNGGASHAARIWKP